MPAHIPWAMWPRGGNQMSDSSDNPKQIAGRRLSVPAGPLPVTGAWRPGDPLGDRQFLVTGDDHPFVLEGGGALRDVTVAYETWGELDADGANAVLVCHALTGDCARRRPHRARATPPPGWWDDADRPGRAARHRPLLRGVRQRARRLPGHAPARRRSTRPPAGPTARRSPSSRSATWSAPRPRLADHLGIDRWLARGRRIDGRHAGARVGGDVPGPGARRSSPHRHHARRPARSRSPSARVGRSADRARPELARRRLLRRRAGRRARTRAWRSPAQIAQITYRTDEVFRERFGRERARPARRPFTLWQRFEVEGYLDYHGDKLVRRFDANSYLVPQQGDGPARPRPRPRRRAERALARIAAPVLTMSIDSRHAVPARTSRSEIRDGLRAPAAGVRPRRDRQPRRPRRLPARDRPDRRRRSPTFLDRRGEADD